MSVLILLVVTPSILAWRESRSPTAYAKFKVAEKTAERQRFYFSWLVESFLMYGLIAILFLLGRLKNLISIPAEYRTVSAPFAFNEDMSEGMGNAFISLLFHRRYETIKGLYKRWILPSF